MRLVAIGTSALCASLALVAACDSSRFQQTPFIQDSASESPRWTVDINRVRDGVFHTYAPMCTDDVRLGHTVEFRNFLPEVPTNVTSISSPEGVYLYSPNLVRPYNYVAADDPDNDLCDSLENGVCKARPAYSFWRHTFDVPGVYDWIDTNQGEPGRKVVDAYYGTVTFVGTDPNTPIATICVPDEDGAGCESVCCSSDADCLGNTTCIKRGQALGRCLTQ